MMPTLMAATRRLTGDDLMRPVRTIQSNASTTATLAPVMAAVRVPPSACMTSQSTFSVYSPAPLGSIVASRVAEPLRTNTLPFTVCGANAASPP